MVKGVIDTYRRALGQLVNVQKYSIHFSTNTTKVRKNECRGVLGFSRSSDEGKYLGLLYIIGRSKKAALDYVKERVVLNKVKGWSGKPVNLAGKELLAKSVLLTMPTYVMACVKLPTGMCKMLDWMIAKNFWNGIDGPRKIHWMCWDRLTDVKGKGGLGFRDLEALDLALLAKQAWQLLVRDDSLFYKLFEAKYFHNSTFLEVQHKANASWAWQSSWASICEPV